MNNISRASLLLALLFLWGGCTTKKAPVLSKGDIVRGSGGLLQLALAAHWNTWSNDGTPLFFAGSPRMRNRDNEWQKALEAAAAQAARYVGVTGESLFYVEKSGRGMGHAGDFRFQWDTSLEGPLMEELEEIQRFQDDNGSYVLLRYPPGEKVHLPPGGSPKGGRPRWLSKPPRIPGYRIGIGSSQRNRYLSDSIVAADEQALEEIVKTISLESFFQQNSIDRGRRGNATAQRSMEVARATVRGFYILARWYESNRGVFYSLGICPEKQD